MKDATLETYNKSAKELSEYFRGIGSRVDDIDRGLQFAGKRDGDADVLELGCGDGRDAAEIAKKCKTYLGIDYSEGLIALARKMVPKAKFEVMSMTEFDYPKEGYDVVFAFASILHVSRDELAGLLSKIASSLRPEGIFYISSKEANDYKEEWKEDQYGKRLFYFYNQEVIEGLGGQDFEVVYSHRGIHGKTQWFELALKKKSKVV